MPYSSTANLPPDVKSALPSAAQNIYLKAANQALKSFANDEKKAAKVAWNAVKMKYKKDGDKWVPKSASESSGGAPKGQNPAKGSGGGVKKAIQIDVPIEKVDEDRRMAFGWAYVSEANGEMIVDHSGENISIGELEKAVYEYNQLSERPGGEMHLKKRAGVLVESIVFTKEKCDAMGIPEDTRQYGWWVGYYYPDDEVWGKVKDGTYKQFSVGGSASKREVA